MGLGILHGVIRLWFPSRRKPATIDGRCAVALFASVAVVTGCTSATVAPRHSHIALRGGPTPPPRFALDDLGASRILDIPASHVEPALEPGVTYSVSSWHLDVGTRTSILKLDEADRALDRRLDLPMKLDVLGVYRHPDTPLDRNTNLGLTTLYLGVGRRESNRITWTAYAGGGAWSDKTRQNALNTVLDVRFRYAAYYAGVNVEFHPWGYAVGRADMTWTQRIEESRPFVLTSLETGYVSAEGKGYLSLASIRLYSDSKKIRDWTFSWLLGLGLEVPMDQRWSFNFSGGYRFHFYRPDQYNGWDITSVMRYRIGLPE